MLLEAAFDASLLADYTQSRQIHEHDGMYEQNNILGPHPSNVRLRNYLIGAAIAHGVVTYWLDGERRRNWQIATLVVELLVVAQQLQDIARDRRLDHEESILAAGQPDAGDLGIGVDRTRNRTVVDDRVVPAPTMPVAPTLPVSRSSPREPPALEQLPVWWSDAVAAAGADVPSDGLAALTNELIDGRHSRCFSERFSPNGGRK